MTEVYANAGDCDDLTGDDYVRPNLINSKSYVDDLLTCID